VPRGFQDYAERNGIAEEFAAVVALVAEQKKYREETRALALRECKHGPQQAGGRLMKGRRVFGPLLNLPGSSPIRPSSKPQLTGTPLDQMLYFFNKCLNDL